MTWSGASLVMMAATLLAAAPARAASCSKDRDCSGNTVCRSGSCVPKLSTATSDSSGTTSNATAANNARPSIVLFGLLPYSGGGIGLGIGARVEYPVAVNVIKEMPFKNDIFVVGGLDYYTHSYDYGFGSSYRVNYFRFEAGAMWNFWFLENFAAYPKLTLNYDVASVSGNVGPTNSYSGVNIDAAAGIIFNLNSAISLRAEVGNFALKAGVGFHFM